MICSPCTLAPLSANQGDGSWASGFTAERDLLLRRIRERVSGRVIFVTGDTHWTMAYDRDGLLELAFAAGRPRLDLSLVRDDGAAAFETSLDG